MSFIQLGVGVPSYFIRRAWTKTLNHDRGVGRFDTRRRGEGIVRRWHVAPEVMLVINLNIGQLTVSRLMGSISNNSILTPKRRPFLI